MPFLGSEHGKNKTEFIFMGCINCFYVSLGHSENRFPLVISMKEKKFSCEVTFVKNKNEGGLTLSNKTCEERCHTKLGGDQAKHAVTKAPWENTPAPSSVPGSVG